MTVFGSVFRVWSISAVPQFPAHGLGLGREGEYEKETGTEIRTDSEAEEQKKSQEGTLGLGPGRQGWPGSSNLAGPEDEAQSPCLGIQGPRHPSGALLLHPARQTPSL